ncbi:MAG: NAD(P)/FAD-dependent oxidoreductase [Clostridia bacterium]|nr:NAD(P)/FAD-dependent oxidoreductase [Clostridia bacterium]
MIQNSITEHQTGSGPTGSSQQTALIIGAGPAGLMAALELLQQTTVRPVVLDEGTSAGGLSRTEIHEGNRMDLGGHRFFSRSEKILEVWKSLLPLQGSPAMDDASLNRPKAYAPAGPDPEKTDRVMLERNRLSRIYFAGHFFDYPVTLSLETLLSLGWRRTMAVGTGYLLALLHKRPEKSLEDFYINRFGRPLYELFFEDYTEKLWGIHPSLIAADWGAQRVKGLSLAKAIGSVLKRPWRKKQDVETSLIETFWYPKLGPGQLWEAMAGQIRLLGGEIVYGAQVERVKMDLGQPNQRYTVETISQGGERRTWTGQTLFSSMPIKDLITALEPEPPPAIREIASGLPYRDFITVGILARRLKIQNTTRFKTLHGQVPDCWIYIQDRSVKLGRLQIFNNWSPYLVKDPVDTIWLGLEYFCSEGDDLWELADRDMVQLALSELTAIGILEPKDVISQTVHHVRKAYPAYFGSYSDFSQVRDYLDTLPDLYCIGRNGQHRYNNMDHSMLTAIEAVRCFQGLTDKSTIWQVNSEQSYGG